jgi:hypothetical protein
MRELTSEMLSAMVDIKSCLKKCLHSIMRR